MTFTSRWARSAAALCALILTFTVTTAVQAVQPAGIFTSNMVLQRGQTVPVFGTANPGETVTVSFANQNQSAVANSSGRWQVNLNSMSASTAPSTMTISGSQSGSVNLTGVQVGEVWLFSGQSNMDMRLDEADESAAYIADAGNHNIRLFLMKSGNGPTTTSWQVSNSTTAAAFSAVGYWTGLELSKKLNVPVGLIQATYDGSAIEEWMTISGTTGANYLSMVKPIQPYAIKGAGWYQGESNGGDSSYGTKLASMIAEWRSDWGLPNLPFGIVQLPSTKWSAARDGQFDVSQTVPNTFLVVSMDQPGSSQLHPTAKKQLGIRMGIGARGLVYGENITISGPVGDGPTSFLSGNKVVVKFDFLGNGLATTGGGAPTGFQVATATGNFGSATAAIVGGNTVELTSSVSNPARVRYSFSTNGNLVNQVSIPVEGGAATVTSLPAPQFDLTIGGGGGGGGGGTKTHVASITVVQTGNGPNKRGQATITVQDENGQPVANATVTGDFTGTFNESGRTGTTNSSGVATITTNGKTSGTVSATFCVSNITHASMSYDSAANVETCDSN